jgi:hypothetical protein
VLIVAWMLTALRNPLLATSGEQGSAKTALSKVLRALVDPNMAPVRAQPRKDREPMIAANNGHLLAFDNLSGLPTWFGAAFTNFLAPMSFGQIAKQLQDRKIRSCDLCEVRSQPKSRKQLTDESVERFLTFSCQCSRSARGRSAAKQSAKGGLDNVRRRHGVGRQLALGPHHRAGWLLFICWFHCCR